MNIIILAGVGILAGHIVGKVYIRRFEFSDIIVSIATITILIGFIVGV